MLCEQKRERNREKIVLKSGIMAGGAILVGNVKKCRYTFRKAHFSVFRGYSSKFLCSYMQIRWVVNLEDFKFAEALVAAVLTSS